MRAPVVPRGFPRAKVARGIRPALDPLPSVAALIALAAAAAAPARADGVAVSADVPPPSLLGRDLVLEREQVELAVALEASLMTGKWGEPSSVAPDAWVGATDELTVGVVHSSRAIGVLDAGLGLCFTGSDHGCPRAYDNAGLDARYAVKRGWLAAAARARLVAASFDPFKPFVAIGGLGRLHRGRFAVIADPHVQIGLANRDQGNRDWIRVPLGLAAEPVLGRWTIALRTGLDGEVAVFGEAYMIPIGIDTTVRVGRVDVSLMAAFPSLLGPLNQYRTRVVWLSASARWP